MSGDDKCRPMFDGANVLMPLNWNRILAVKVKTCSLEAVAWQHSTSISSSSREQLLLL